MQPSTEDIEDGGDQPFGALRPGFPARAAWLLATTKRLPRPARKWFRKRLAVRFPGPFDVEAEGVRLRAWPAENRCDRVAVGRGVLPEAPERRLVDPLLRPDMTFVDIGANVGVYSLHVSARTGGGARVLALEPHPRTFAKLARNVALNGFDRILALNLAAGPEAGEALLFSDGGGNIGGASMLEGKGAARQSVAVATCPLPDILRDNSINRIDLLKADVEGYEDRALMPLLDDPTLEPLWPGAVLIETVNRSLWRTDVVAALEGRGYHVAGRTEENLLLTR
ncbi:MAG: FkbM family methyltransferase [Rhizobiaceae bacterium]